MSDAVVPLHAFDDAKASAKNKFRAGRWRSRTAASRQVEWVKSVIPHPPPSTSCHPLTLSTAPAKEVRGGDGRSLTSLTAPIG
jgi:hypothetical protein